MTLRQKKTPYNILARPRYGQRIAAVICVFYCPCSGVGAYPDILFNIVGQACSDGIMNYWRDMDQGIADGVVPLREFLLE